MGAILGGTMRSPFTGVIFALELTHDVNALLPLLVAVTIAHGFTVLTLRRSILTEKVSRRGYHMSREYAVDPLEILFVREVMRTDIVALPAALSLGEVAHLLHNENSGRRQRLYPVLTSAGALAGIVTGNALQRLLQEPQAESHGRQLVDAVQPHPVVAHPDEPLRVVVYRMAQTGCTQLPVVDRHKPQTLLGIISLSDLLKARTHHLEEEQRRERVLQLRLRFPSRNRRLRQMT
jgi:chloride channel protein, CIC family